MEGLGYDDSDAFIAVTHAASINDTFWVKAETDSLSWNDVSLFRNPFNKAVSRLAFNGAEVKRPFGAYRGCGMPELACDGSFRKCFVREPKADQFGSGIFLYKREYEYSAGLEPYCEHMASEIAKLVSPNNAVAYELTNPNSVVVRELAYRFVPATRCGLFTSEQYGFAPYSAAAETNDFDLHTVLDYFERLGAEQEFREMLVIDSLCFNQDRHMGNFGLLFDNDTLQVKGMAPVFDLNISLLPFVEYDELKSVGDALFEHCVPRLGEDFTRFGQECMNDVIRGRVKELADFTFSFRGDSVFPEERVRLLERVVRQQAKALLSADRLFTRDVFFSNAALESERKLKRAEEADKLMNGFFDTLKTLHISGELFVSQCSSADTVRLYIEKENQMLTLDFLRLGMRVTNNERPVSPEELEKTDADFSKAVSVIREALRQYLAENRAAAKHPTAEQNNEKKELCHDKH